MKNPFEKQTIVLELSITDMIFLIRMIQSVVPSNMDEGTIVKLHDDLVAKLQEMQNA